MQNKFKEIGYFSRAHGYKGKIVISFTFENSSILKNNSTIWVEEFGIPTPYKIEEIQKLNKNKRILSLLNLNNNKAEELKNKKVYVDPKDDNIREEYLNNNIDNYKLYNQDNELIGLIILLLKYNIIISTNFYKR